MTKSVQFRRGSTVSHMSFTGRQGEITVDTDKKTAVVHDEIKVGGYPLLKEDLSNLNNDALINKGILLTDLSNITDETIINKGIALSNLSNVSEVSIKEKGFLKSDLSNITEESYATEEKLGVIKIATQSEIENGTSNTSALTPLTFNRNIAQKLGLSKGYIKGYTYFQFETNSTKEILIQEGSARSSDDSCDITLSAPISKKVNLSFEKGNGAGGLAPNLTYLNNRLYYVFVLLNPNTGEVDCGYDEDYNCVNLLTNIFGFTKYRRIGRIKIDNSENIIPFVFCKENNDGSIEMTLKSLIQIETRINSSSTSWYTKDLGLGKNYKGFFGTYNFSSAYSLGTNDKFDIGVITGLLGNQSLYTLQTCFIEEKLYVGYRQFNNANSGTLSLYKIQDERK